MGFWNKTPRVIDNSTGEVVNPGDTGKRCNFRWDTTPKFPRPNGHYKHWCGMRPHKTGDHMCNANWDCGETHSREEGK